MNMETDFSARSITPYSISIYINVLFDCRELRAKTSIAATSGHGEEGSSSSSLGKYPSSKYSNFVSAPDKKG